MFVFAFNFQDNMRNVTFATDKTRRLPALRNRFEYMPVRNRDRPQANSNQPVSAERDRKKSEGRRENDRHAGKIDDTCVVKADNTGKHDTSRLEQTRSECSSE